MCSPVQIQMILVHIHISTCAWVFIMNIYRYLCVWYKHQRPVKLYCILRLNCVLKCRVYTYKQNFWRVRWIFVMRYGVRTTRRLMGTIKRTNKRPIRSLLTLIIRNRVEDERTRVRRMRARLMVRIRFYIFTYYYYTFINHWL